MNFYLDGQHPREKYQGKSRNNLEEATLSLKQIKKKRAKQQ